MPNCKSGQFPVPKDPEYPYQEPDFGGGLAKFEGEKVMILEEGAPIPQEIWDQAERDVPMTATAIMTKDEENEIAGLSSPVILGPLGAAILETVVKLLKDSQIEDQRILDALNGCRSESEDTGAVKVLKKNPDNGDKLAAAIAGVERAKGDH